MGETKEICINFIPSTHYYTVMKKNIFSLSLLVFILVQLDVHSQNASLVNPFIGTARSHALSLWGNYGGTYPGAVAPWGRVQLTPETSIRPSERGYYYSDDKIRSFSCVTHRSGYPNGSAGRVHLLFIPDHISELSQEYDGRAFCHTQEQATPGYYSVHFQTGDQVETTAMERTGIFRYHSDKEQTTLVICNAGNLSVGNQNTINADFFHTVFRFNHPWKKCTLRNDTAYLYFDKAQTKDGLQIKLGTSIRNFEGSLKNMDAEIPGWDFEAVRQSAYNLWDEELSCVRIKSDDKDNKEKFYTALYHSFLMPWIVSDVQTQTGNTYAEFSAWDTFRSLHPLLSLLKPDRQKDMIRSAMNEYRAKGFLPKGPMTGMHMIPVLVDAYVKEAVDENAEELYQAMLSCYGERDLQNSLSEYLQKGYIGASKEKSVSITTEFAYDDWALGHFARLTGRKADAEKLIRRSFNYRNLFDGQTLFMLPKDENGFVRNSGELGYQESNRWTASCFVPHNIQDLINLSGGTNDFVNHLQKGYSEGKIIHDNEPVFHYPYLFCWAGRPDITHRIVNRILNEDYSSRPGGIPGNDDLGSTSSWFVFSALGLFPACPGTGEYILTPPLFDHIEIRLHNGKTLTIDTEDEPQQAATSYPTILFNGKMHNSMYIDHHAIANGGRLAFDYGSPITDFSSYERPFSETKEKPDFKITATIPAQSTMSPNQSNHIVFHVTNKGVQGSFAACLYDDTAQIATKRVMVQQGHTLADTLSFTLYKEGKHKINLGDYTYTIVVKDSAERTQPFICTRIIGSPLLPVNEKVSWQIVCKNISGKPHKREVPVLVNGKAVATLKVSLAPGEQQTISMPYTACREGFLDVNVLGCHKRVKAYSQNTSACLLHLDYNHKDDLFVYDQSGFGNHGELHGSLQWGKQGGQGTIQTGEQAYVVFPLSESLQSVYNNQLTIATWIYPQEPPRGDADFFTKGDYSLFKMEGARRLAFFAGGWGRGECQVNVPEDWYTRWHHIAGVCTGSSIKLYIDGQLIQEIQVEGELAETELPWNLGRNAEMPYSRFSHMKFGSSRIYGAALSDEEVAGLYEADYNVFVGSRNADNADGYR